MPASALRSSGCARRPIGWALARVQNASSGSASWLKVVASTLRNPQLPIRRGMTTSLLATKTLNLANRRSRCPLRPNLASGADSPLCSSCRLPCRRRVPLCVRHSLPARRGRSGLPCTAGRRSSALRLRRNRHRSGPHRWCLTGSTSFSPSRSRADPGRRSHRTHPPRRYHRRRCSSDPARCTYGFRRSRSRRRRSDRCSRAGPDHRRAGRFSLCGHWRRPHRRCTPVASGNTALRLRHSRHSGRRRKGRTLRHS
jgi:hypothetical protein